MEEERELASRQQPGARRRSRRRCPSRRFRLPRHAPLLPPADCRFLLLSRCSTMPAVEYSPFYGIEKGAVLQEARVFNDSHVDPRRCQQVITKLLYLLTQGESFTKVRATAAARTQPQQHGTPGRQRAAGVQQRGLLLSRGRPRRAAAAAAGRRELCTKHGACRRAYRCCCAPRRRPQSEASDVFFSVTKLFQHKDVHLRRMVYLVIKEIIPSSDEVIIITSRWVGGACYIVVAAAAAGCWRQTRCRMRGRPPEVRSCRRGEVRPPATAAACSAPTAVPLLELHCCHACRPHPTTCTATVPQPDEGHDVQERPVPRQRHPRAVPHHRLPDAAADRALPQAGARPKLGGGTAVSSGQHLEAAHRVVCLRLGAAA